VSRPTVRVTVGQAVVRWLLAQRTVLDGAEAPLFAGVFAIFGHGNVTCLGEALYDARERLPTFRGNNEQGMALAGVAFAKAKRRRQIMVATSSIGPGALNMVTAAAVAMADRLPLLLLPADTFASRVPDPVLQQVEHPAAPSVTANDAFRAVVRYWDRVGRPEQLVRSLPAALGLLLDPAECGPAVVALPQDVQAQAWDFPEAFFETRVHEIPRPRPDALEVERAATALRRAERPVVIAGGGTRYSLAEGALSGFAARHGVPVTETMAGRGSLCAEDPAWTGPLGVTGWPCTNTLVGQADVVLAVGTRLGDFTTSSWTLFAEDATVVGVNAARFDAVKHSTLPVVGDALVALGELDGALGGWAAPRTWTDRAAATAAAGRADVARRTAPGPGPPSYAQVIGALWRSATAEDYVLTAAGGLPGELNANWLVKAPGTFDCEYGFSCMGYEIAGGWGAAMARSAGQVFVLVGDGSYLMANSELYSSILSGHKVVAVVCDNGGFAVIERLALEKCGRSFNNMFSTVAPGIGPVDFAAHAAALGCHAEAVSGLAGLEAALERARRVDRSVVLVIRTDPDVWSASDAFWEVGVPEVSNREVVLSARRRLEAGKARQWVAP
jgi:3D-(3,5/4)-trihydroxycyclohexane-1,2-dione acylhydrolase (decyclizing)